METISGLKWFSQNKLLCHLVHTELKQLTGEKNDVNECYFFLCEHIFSDI